jgi:hypothetical protein
VFALASWREPALSSASQAGMVNNLNDGMAWGLFPILFATAGLSLTQIGALAALYPAVWGLGQLLTGPPQTATAVSRSSSPACSSKPRGWRWSRSPTASPSGRRCGAARRRHRRGVPDAARRDLRRRPPRLASPRRRRLPAVARRRFRRGALLAGGIADLAGIRAAVWVVAALTAASGLLAAARMYETHPRSVPGSGGER